MIASLFRAEAVVVEAPTALVDDQLFPDEWAYIRRAAPKRRAEFGTARVLARRALAKLGLPPVSLVPRADRAPVWPAGVVGSIAHTDDRCAVVLDRSPPLRSLGLDVETIAPLEAGTRAQILTPAERPWLAAMPTGRRDELALLVFSAKEAYYKCQYPLSGVVLDFQDVEVEIDLPRARFEARARKPGLPADLARLTGRCASAEGRVMCGVTVTGSR